MPHPVTPLPIRPARIRGVDTNFPGISSVSPKRNNDDAKCRADLGLPYACDMEVRLRPGIKSDCNHVCDRIRNSLPLCYTKANRPKSCNPTRAPISTGVEIIWLILVHSLATTTTTMTRKRLSSWGRPKTQRRRSQSKIGRRSPLCHNPNGRRRSKQKSTSAIFLLYWSGNTWPVLQESLKK